MKHIWRKFQMLVLLWLLSQSKLAFSEELEVTVIGHHSVAEQVLTPGQLRRIFLRKQTQWPDGSAITVFVLPNDHKSHLAFTTKILKMFPYQIERFWNKLTYSGIGEAPLEVDSLSNMLKKVSSTPGAIGYIGSQQSIPEKLIISVRQD